jgi:hypothetical protein
MEKTIIKHSKQINDIKGETMILVPVKCQHQGSDNVKKDGTANNGKQRFYCYNKVASIRHLLRIIPITRMIQQSVCTFSFCLLMVAERRQPPRFLELPNDTVTDTIRVSNRCYSMLIKII